MNPTQYTICLSWPDMRLSGNGRLHWRAKSRLVIKHRNSAYYTALEAGVRRADFKACKRAIVSFDYRRPTGRGCRADEDNIITACKSYQDGIADAIGVDDGKWDITREFGDPVAGGAVNVTVRAG